MLDYQAERKFLHDLATPLTVLKAILKSELTELDRSADEGDLIEKRKVRIQKGLAAIEKISDLHADRKEEIFLKEQAAS